MPKRMSPDQFKAEVSGAQRSIVEETGFRETGIAWLGNEAGVVIIPPNERRHPAEAFWAYADINGRRQVIRLANYAADLTYSNKDKHKAVRIGIPPNQEFLGVLGIAPENAKVFGPALPNQVQAAKQTYLTPDRFQMLRLSPAGDRRLQIEAGWFYDGGTLRYIESGDFVDLDSHFPGTTGETRIVLIGWAEDDTVRVLEGDPFVMVSGDSIMNHLPTDDFSEGDVPIGGAILVNGETTLEQKRILPFLPFFRAIRDTGIIPLPRGGGGFDLSTIQGLLFYNLGTAYQVHCVGEQIAAPTVDDDETVTPNPFGVLSLWVMSVTAGAAENAVYMCVDPSAGAAVWLRLDGSGGGGSMSSFGIAGDSGTGTITDGETLTITGDTGLGVTVSGNTFALDLDTDLSTIAGLAPANDDIIQRKAGAWINRTPAQVKADLAIASTDISDFTEAAQDAVGNNLSDSSTVNFTYVDGSGSFTADVQTDSITNFHLSNMAALTVKVRAANSTGDPSDLAFGTDGRVLIRRSSALVTDTLTSADLTDFSEAVQDVVGALIAAGANVTVTYNDAGNTLTIAVTDEAIQDVVGALLADSATIDFTYNDAGNSLTAIVIDDSITNAKLANMNALTLKGNATNSAANPTDIAASANGQTPVTSGSTIVWQNVPNQGANVRLSLSPTDPIADNVSGTTIYAHPFGKNLITLCNAHNGQLENYPIPSTPLSDALPSTFCQPYDYFGYPSGGNMALERVAWNSPLSGSITGATNATPIRITSNSHGLTTDDIVVISGVLGNTNANGLYRVVVISANTFDLYTLKNVARAGSGTYTSGGTWVRFNQVVSRATAIVWSDTYGFYHKSGDTSRRLLGSVMTGYSTAGQTHDTPTQRLVSNANPEAIIWRDLMNTVADEHNYNAATRRAWNNDLGAAEVDIFLSTQRAWFMFVNGSIDWSATPSFADLGLGDNTYTANQAQTDAFFQTSAYATSPGTFAQTRAVGLHRLVLNQFVSGGTNVSYNTGRVSGVCPQ